MKHLLLLLIPLSLLTNSCLEDENAFTVEASPVKAEINMISDPTDETIIYEGTFTELDKAAILDVNVGIVATPVVNLQISVTDQEQNVLESLTTDAEGMAVLSLDASSLTGVTRLEWAGTYDGKAFRILKNL